jgi:hypothetical protein
MSDHEQLHEAREREADRLEQERDALDAAVDRARDARDDATGDQLIATPAPGDRAEPGAPSGDLSEAARHTQEGDEPGGPETDYPTKD